MTIFASMLAAGMSALTSILTALFAGMFLTGITSIRSVVMRAVIYSSFALPLYLTAYDNLDGNVVALAWIYLGVVLVAIAEIDLRTMLVPDVLVFCVGISGLAVSFAFPDPVAVLWDRAIGGTLGGSVMALTATAFARVRGADGIGLGDVKLASAGGFWAGWQEISLMLLLAAIFGIALTLIRSRGHLQTQLRVPFAPALSLSIAIVSVTALVWHSVSVAD